MRQQPLVGQGLRNIETSRSYSDTPYSVGLLRTSDQPATETSTSHKRDIHASGGIRTRNPSKPLYADRRLRLRAQ